MKSIGKTIGSILWLGSGLLMFVFWLLAMSQWLGFLGIILSFVLAPGLVIFPLVYWIVEGVFPTLYFLLWGMGIVGLIIQNISSNSD